MANWWENTNTSDTSGSSTGGNWWESESNTKFLNDWKTQDDEKKKKQLEEQKIAEQQVQANKISEDQAKIEKMKSNVFYKIGSTAQKLWNNIKGTKPEPTQQDVETTQVLSKALFDFSNPDNLKNTTELAFTNLKTQSANDYNESKKMLQDLSWMKDQKTLTPDDTKKLVNYFKQTTYLKERKVDESGKDIVKDWQYELTGDQVKLRSGSFLQGGDIKKLIPNIEEAINTNIVKLDQNQKLIDEFTGATKADTGLFTVLASQLKSGELEPFKPDAIKVKNKENLASAIEKIKGGTTLQELSMSERMGVTDLMNQQLEDSINRGFWSEIVGSVVPSTRMSIEFGLGSLLGGAMGGSGTISSIVGKDVLGGNIGAKAIASDLSNIGLQLQKTDNGEVYFNVTKGAMGDVEANNRAYISSGIQDIIEVGLGKVADKVIGVAGKGIGKVTDNAVVPLLSKTEGGVKVLNLAKTITAVGDKIFNNNSPMQFYLQKLGRNDFLSELSENVAQDVTSYVVEGQDLNLASAEYWTTNIVSTLLLTGLFGSTNLATDLTDIKDRKKFMQTIKENTDKLDGFDLNEQGQLVDTTKNEVINTPEAFKEAFDAQITTQQEATATEATTTNIAVPEVLTQEVNKYETVKDFISAYTDKTSTLANAFDQSTDGSVSSEAQTLNNAFTEYTNNTEIQKQYDQGKTDTEILKQLYNDVKGIKEELKTTSKSDVAQQTTLQEKTNNKFYTREGDKYVEQPKAQTVVLNKEIDTFIYQDPKSKQFDIVEAKTGGRVASGATYEEAVTNANALINKLGLEKFQARIQETIKEKVSPRYEKPIVKKTLLQEAVEASGFVVGQKILINNKLRTIKEFAPSVTDSHGTLVKFTDNTYITMDRAKAFAGLKKNLTAKKSENAKNLAEVKKEAVQVDKKVKATEKEITMRRMQIGKTNAEVRDITKQLDAFQSSEDYKALKDEYMILIKEARVTHATLEQYIYDMTDLYGEDASKYLEDFMQRWSATQATIDYLNDKKVQLINSQLIKEGYEVPKYRVIRNGITGEKTPNETGGVLSPLITLHNINSENLILADKAGGLIAPSVAVTKPKNPIADFGEITLVGGREMVDPDVDFRNKLYSHDVYSPRVTQPTYDVNRRGLEKFFENREVIKAFDEVDSYSYDLEQEARTDNAKVNFWYGAERSMGLMNYYMKQIGINVKPVTYKAHDTGETKVDVRETRDLFRKRRGDGYEKWVDDTFQDYFGEAYVKVGKEKLSYTAENIVESMFGKGLKGQEGGMFGGLNKIKAIGAKSYKTIEQAKRDSYGRLVSEEEYNKITTRQYATFSNKQEELAKYNRFARASGDLYGNDQNLENAMTDYAKKSRTWNSFVSAFSVNGYDFDPEIDSYLIQKTKNWADGILSDPVPYLEGKLRRVVKIGEFTGAIVPLSYKGKEIEQILRSNGITRIEYIGDSETDSVEKRKADIIESKFSDVKYRMSDNTDIQLTPEQIKKVEDMNKKYFGDSQLRIVDKLLTENGQEVLGRYLNGWIDILKNKGEFENTYYHEAGHKAFSLFKQKDPINAQKALQEIIDTKGEGYLTKKWGQYRVDSVAKYLYETARRQGVRGYDEITSMLDIDRNLAILTADMKAQVKRSMAGMVMENSRLTLTRDQYESLNELDKHDYKKYLYPKLVKLEESGMQFGQRVIIKTGQGKWVDTDVVVALNRGVNRNTVVELVNDTDLTSTGNSAKDERGERFLINNIIARYRGADMSNSNLEMLAEEELVENFYQYKINRETPTGKVKQVLGDLWEFVKSLVGASSQVKRLYRELYEGKFSKDRINVNQYQYMPKYRADLLFGEEIAPPADSKFIIPMTPEEGVVYDTNKRTRSVEDKTQKEIEIGIESGVSTPATRVVTAFKPVLDTTGVERDSTAFNKIRDRYEELQSTDPQLQELKYKQMKIADVTAIAMNFVDKYEDHARRVTLGTELPPEGTTNIAVSLAYTEKMFEQGKWKQAREADRALSYRGTRFGQEIVSFRGRLNENSAMYFVDAVLNARRMVADTLTFKAGTLEGFNKAKDAKVQTLAKTLTELKLQKAEDFINNLIC